MSPAPENSEVRRVMDLVWSVRAFGDSPTPAQWMSVLPWTEPLIERTWLDGAPSRATAERVLSLAMCVLGDAYRELGRPSEAAAAYRRALDFNVGAPCIDYYTKMVLEHSLAEYYAHAAVALPRNDANWQQTSFCNALVFLRNNPVFNPAWPDSVLARPSHTGSENL